MDTTGMSEQSHPIQNNRIWCIINNSGENDKHQYLDYLIIFLIYSQNILETKVCLNSGNDSYSGLEERASKMVKVCQSTNIGSTLTNFHMRYAALNASTTKQSCAVRTDATTTIASIWIWNSKSPAGTWKSLSLNWWIAQSEWEIDLRDFQKWGYPKRMVYEGTSF